MVVRVVPHGHEGARGWRRYAVFVDLARRGAGRSVRERDRELDVPLAGLAARGDPEFARHDDGLRGLALTQQLPMTEHGGAIPSAGSPRSRARYPDTPPGRPTGDPPRSSTRQLGLPST